MNALSPNDITESGISTDVRFEHRLNVLLPMDIKDDGVSNSNEVSPEHPENALLPIVSTALGMVMDSMLEQL